LLPTGTPRLFVSSSERSPWHFASLRISELTIVGNSQEEG
jgi:hypothetical protein